MLRRSPMAARLRGYETVRRWRLRMGTVVAYSGQVSTARYKSVSTAAVSSKEQFRNRKSVKVSRMQSLMLWGSEVSRR